MTMLDRPPALCHGGRVHLDENDPRDAVTALVRAARDFPTAGVRTPQGFQAYPQLLERARRILTGLRSTGLSPGDHVVLVGLPLADFFPAFWACVLGGMRPVAIADAPAGPVLDRIGHTWRLLDRPAVITDGSAVPGIPTVDLALLEDHPAATESHRPAELDVALLILSSGSTGAPKAAQLTHRALSEFCAGTRRMLDIRPGDVTLNWLPLDHSGAFLFYHLLEVFVGATNIHLPTEDVVADPLRWLDELAAHRVNHAWSPTFGLQLAATAIAAAPNRTWDLGAIRSLVCGGEQVTLSVVRRFLQLTEPFGLATHHFVPCWGMAETTTAITLGNLESPGGIRHVHKSSLGGDLEWAAEEEPGTVTFVAVGPPAPGATVRVVDSSGQVLPEGRIGRLQVAGNRVTTGYVNNPGATAAILPHDGRWLHTGDLAFIADGQVVITGREQDIIVLNGHNVFCHEIEEVAGSVAGAPAGGIGACGVPSPATGSDELVVCYEHTDATPADLASRIRAALFTRLRLPAVRVVAVPAGEFPRTGSGKVRRGALRDRVTTSPGVDGVDAVVRDTLGADLDEHKPFYELGLSSLELVRLKARLEQALGTTIPTTAMFEHPTIAALTAYVSGKPARPPARSAPPAAETRIAIIGMAARFPGADTLDEYWSNLRAGVDSVQTFGPADATTVRVAGTLSDVDSFDAEFFGIPPSETELTHPGHRLFLECAYQALEHSGHAATAPGVRVGVYAGSGMNLYGHQDRMSPATDIPTAMRSTIGTEPDFLATRVAYRLGLTGPAIGVRTACSTSLVAVHLAAQGLLSGDADMAVAGATAVRVPQDSGYQNFPGSILSPTGRCRAFDADADGTVGGNGVAAVVLKRLDRAIEDGDTVHAVILATAVNNDGTSKVGFAAPSVAGQVDVVREALRRAGVRGDSISYVEAHGTGTKLGDPIEVEALRQALGADTDRTGFCTLGSVKPNIGHLDSCAGMAGLIKTVLMLEHRELVPTINISHPNPELRLAAGPFVLGTEARPWTVDGDQPRRAGVSALGVGGTNAHVILQEAPGRPVPAPAGPVVVPLSARSAEDLAELAGRLRDHLLRNPDLPAADVATTMALGRPRLPHRTAVVGSTAAELAEALADLPEPGRAGPIVFAFCGQDADLDDAADQLRSQFPMVADMLSACDSPLLQSRLFAYQAALVDVWRSIGVEPDVLIGHSAGEYAALYAAGALSFADGLRLTTVRGELMQRTEPGGMVGVMATPATAERIAGQAGCDVAAVNGAQAVVLSGGVPAIERAIGLLDQERLVWRRMNVDRAFHSALIDPILPELRQHAAEVSLLPLRRRMISTVDGTVLSTVDPGYLCGHARRPVRFDKALDAVRDAGLFVEIGPGSVLSHIGRRALPNSTWTASARMADALAHVYRSGRSVDWKAVSHGRRVPLPGHPLRRLPVAQPSPVQPAGDAAVDSIRDLVARQLGLASVDADRSFLDMGADSLALMNVVREIDQTWGVRIPVRDLFDDLNTCRKLASRAGPIGAPAPTAVSPERAEPPATPTDPDPGLRSIIEQQLSLMAQQLTLLRGDTAAPAAGPAVAPPVATAGAAVVPTAAVVPAPAEPTTSGCDFSLYFFGDYPDEAGADKYRLLTTAARYADEHGFHALWLPERHFHSFGALFPNPSVLAAALAAQTNRIRLHAGSVVLPLHSPLRVVEEWSVVDNLSGGRAGLCVASGWHARDFVLAPENYGRHREELYDRLVTVRRLWAGEPVTATAGNGEEVEVRVQPRPIQSAPPMFVAVVGNPDSYRRAAREDLGVVTNLMTQTAEELAENIALYRRARAEHGLDPAAGRVVVLVHTYLGEDLEAVRTEAFEPFCAYLRSSLTLFGQVTNSLGMRIDLDDTPDDDVAFLLAQAYQRYCDSRALIGTVDSCGRVLDGLLAAGADEIACFVDFGVPTDRVLAGLSTLDLLRERFTATPTTRPATAAERRIWFLEQLYPGQHTYHEPKAIRLTGPLDVAALRGALRKVVARQPALRSVFRDVDGIPHRFVLSDMDIECPVVDATGRTEDDVLAEMLCADGRRTFDLADGPLVLARLIRFTPDHHVLFLLAHHIVFDSASTSVLTKDLAAYYRRWPSDPNLPALAPDTPASDSAADLGYWRDLLADAPELLLPHDRPRPAVRTGAGAFLAHELDEGLARRVQRLAREHEVTPFLVLLSAFACTLARYSGQDDLVIATGLAGRPPGADDRIGMFVDTVPLRLDLSGDPEFAVLARRIRQSTMDAFEHRRTSFDELVAALQPVRDPARNPLFDIAIEYETADTVEFDPPRLSTTFIDMPTDRAPVDLVLYLTHAPDHIRCAVEYDNALFDESTVQRLLSDFEHVLRSATAGTRLSQLGLTGADERFLATVEGSDVPDASVGLHELVESQPPQALAITGPLGELTYRQLDERANDIAWQLTELGVTAGEIVGVHLPRGTDYIAAVLGVLKCGAAFLPLDPALPTERLRFMVTDSGAAVLLADRSSTSLAELPTLFIDDIGGRADRPKRTTHPNDLAYCMYTSGSTDAPKGVLVPHRGVVNLVQWHVRNHPPTRTMQWSSTAFDGHVYEIFTTLGSGAALVPVGDETRYDPSAVADVIRTYSVERFTMPFTPLLHLLATRPSLPSLREVVSAGEPTEPTPLVHEFLAAHPRCALYNMYGPTEGSIAATEHQVASGETRPPIGRPLTGVRIQLLDPFQQRVPVGAVGEIVLSGVCVANGYLGRPVENAVAFVDKRVYRTGDRGRWRADGSLEFHGRTDDQVKIRGVRIELGEIRHTVTRLPEVQDAAVVVRDGELVGYVVTEASEATLTERLATRLPASFVPRQWVRVPRLPVTANGKLDLDGLPAVVESPVWAPVTDVQRTVHELWCREFGRSDVGIDQSFFELGGNSLTMVRMLKDLRAKTGADLSMTGFMANPTIRAVAAALEPRESALLTRAQRRLWRRHHARLNSSVYNGLSRVDVEGELDPATVERVMTTLVQRHAALRTQVSATHQQVLAPFPVSCPVTDLPDDEARIQRWCIEQASGEVDLSVAPLWRAALGRVSPTRWVFVFVPHHMIFDGWSATIFWQEFAALYRGGELPAPSAQYPDYARAEGATLADSADLVSFWRKELTGATLYPSLPYDLPRPETLSGAGATIRQTMPAAAVHRAAAASATTPNVIIMRTFARWLTEVSGDDDVVLATSSARRTDSAYDTMIGYVGEAVLVRLRPGDDVADRLYEALDHQALPLSEVVEAAIPHEKDMPYPAVLFTVVTTPPHTADLGTSLRTRISGHTVPGQARTELYVVFTLVEETLTLDIEYSTDLFVEATVRGWATELLTALSHTASPAASGEARPG